VRDATVMQLELFASAGSEACVDVLIAQGRLDQPSWMRDRLLERPRARGAQPDEFAAA
jgi:hypothetical protein